MPYEVVWGRRVERKLTRLPKDVQRRIYAAIEDLKTDPRPPGVSKMQGTLAGFWRIYVGRSYRVMYEIDDSTTTVTIRNVGSREEIY